VFEFLHQGNDDSVQFSDVQRVTAALAQGIKLVQQKDAGRALGEMKQLAKMDCRLSEVSANNGIEPHHINWNAKLACEGPRCQALPTAWSAVEEEFRSRFEATPVQRLSLLPLGDDGLEQSSGGRH
jgi:hypothetical protein